MEAKRVDKQRGAQVLEKLCQYGPLSLRTLEEILQPKISQRRIQEVTARLVKRELIYRLDTPTSRSGTQMFEVRRAKLAKEAIAGALGVPVGKLEYAYVRQWEHRHGEQCARWAEFFRRAFPDCWVVRDWEFRRSPFLVERMVGGTGDRDLYPDLAICFERKEDKQRVVIGVEIERNYKKLERLVYKTRSLVMKTQLDGVLFVCSNSGIEDSIRASFRNGISEKSRRIGRYLENFLLFSSAEHSLEGADVSVSNVAHKTKSLAAWVETLRRISPQLRTNSSFDMPA